MLRGIRAAHAVTSKTSSIVAAKCSTILYHFGSCASTETCASLNPPTRQEYRHLVTLKLPNDQTNQHNQPTNPMNIFHNNFHMISYQKSTRMSVDHQQSPLSLPFVHAVPTYHRTEQINEMEPLTDDKLHLVSANIQLQYRIDTPIVRQDIMHLQQLNDYMDLESFSSLLFPTSLTSRMICSPVSDYYCMNRNARRGKRANKGKRPCSRQHQRKRRRRFGSHRR